MGIYLRGQIWWMRIEADGVRRRFSLRTTERHEAKLLADSILAKRAADKAALRAQGRLVRAGLAPDKSAHLWAAERWSRMNYREKQAVIFALFKGKCVYCLEAVTIPLAREKLAPKRAVLDHKIPVSGDGHDGFDNIVLSCNECNIRKYDGAKP